MAEGDRYGSPYDPKNWNWGKIPPEQRGKANYEKRAPERNILGPGCGNPACPQCYPDTYRKTLDMSPSEREEFLRGIQATNARLRSGSMFYFTSERLDQLTTEALFEELEPSGPPKSYKDAREKVENFILKADPTAFDDIVGNEKALESLIDAIQAPVKYADLYSAYGMKMPKGALLSGPPGCGKTMFARAAASEFIKLYGGEVEFISIQSTDIQSMFVGRTEEHIRNIFNFAREYMAYRKHPLLVFMDEAEIMFPDRTGRMRPVSPWEESQVATFLAEMDGVRESCVFMLLATNRPEAIDSALLRDGRCDFKIVVERPTRESSEIILRKNFVHTLCAEEDKETLVIAALESIYDGNKIINEAGAIKADFAKRKVEIVLRRHFLLEDIVSGAMLASVPARATRLAFARDKHTGFAKGVTVSDVIEAVNGIFTENKKLDHPYAQDEFMRKFQEDLEENQKDE